MMSANATQAQTVMQHQLIPVSEDIVPPEQVSIADFCIALYCANAKPGDLVADAHGRIAFTARVVDGDREDYYRVECSGVQNYGYSTEVAPRAWTSNDRLELSTVELEGLPGSWRVCFTAWDLHTFEFHCNNIRINGADVVGKGHHFQDGLPSRPAVVPPYSQGAA